MKYKHFYISLTIRILYIILLSVAGTYVFSKGRYIITAIIFIFLVLASISLIKYFNKINRWISFFLLGIENEDTTLNIPSKTGNKAIDEVFKGMSRLNDIFKQTKIDITTQEQYFKTSINQSATGLFSVNENGRVININPSATKLIGLQEYHHINALKKIDKYLPEFIEEEKRENKEKTAVFENKYGQKILFKVSHIATTKGKTALISVSDITKELDTREVDAWVKLARTLSHEIMNNITPITTLSHVISGYFKKNKQTIKHTELNDEIIENTVKGLDVIEERSKGLMNFVHNYRKFTKLPQPEFSETNVSKLLENNLLTASTYNGFEKITIERNIPTKIFFKTDSELFSQVITNILKNAIEATRETKNPIISIRLTEESEGINISIKNNGPKISKEIANKIFIPFYTTKEEGTGIGLSLSKQILLTMNGDINMITDILGNTIFEIVLNK